MSMASEILGEAVKFPQYQKGYLNVIKGTVGKRIETSCNLFSRDALDSTFKTGPHSWAGGIGGLISEWNYDISPINLGASIANCILNTPIPTAYHNLLKAAQDKLITDCTAQFAQMLANSGELVHVVSVMFNHEAIVIPDADNEFNEIRGCYIANVGGHSGLMYMSDKRTFGAFKNWHSGDIKYYLYKRR